MSNQLAVIGGGPPALAQQRKSVLNDAAQANVQSSFAIVSYKGKVWKLKWRGEEVELKDDRGLPQQALDVVVVGVAPGISKQFYDKGFVEGDSAAPDCFSVNGVSPDPSAPKKQCATCAACPKNAWGSKITEAGTKAKACQDSRRIAVVPDGDLENEGFGGPVMMRMPPTTLANFAQYGAMLSKRGAGMEYVVTRMTFDTSVAYPKITFAPIRWLDQQEAITIVGENGAGGGVMDNPVIERMLNDAVEEVAHDPNAAAGTGAADADPLAAGGPAQAFTAPPAAVAPTPVPTPAPTPQPTPAPQPVVTPTPAARGFGSAAPAQAATAATAAPVAAKKGFGATKAAVEPTAQAQPVTAPTQPVNVVQQAPSDMESAIDSLLAD